MIVTPIRAAGRSSCRVFVSVRHLTQKMCPGLGDEAVERCLMEPNSIDPSRPQPRVVIVGAGIAGLSAAQRLAYCGLSNLIVLEATDRPGGRIHSCWLGDTVVELGAQWIHGASPANSVYTLAAQEGFLEDGSRGYMDSSPRPYFAGSKYSDTFYVTSDGKTIDAGLARAASSSFANIEAQIRSLFSIGANRPRGSLLDFAERRIKEEVKRFPEFQRYDAAKVMHARLSKLRSEAGANLACISADQLGSTVVIPGGDVRVPIGYVGILAPLLRDLPDCSVRYCKVVENIRWSGGGGQWGAPPAVVRTCDGDEFPADYVIVTVSLGVLKRSDCLFSPPLPAPKIEAIKLLGMGSINKVFLEYKKPFWSMGRGSIALAWSPDELRESTGWTSGITSIEEVPGSRCLLCVTVTGEDACCVEGMSDSSLAESITKVLRQFTGDPCIPFPNFIMRSRWTTDPFVRGARSFLSLDSTVGQQCDLGAPLPDACGPENAVLLFAGEATCPGYYGTVHGARISGLREAERVLALHRKSGSKS